MAESFLSPLTMLPLISFLLYPRVPRSLALNVTVTYTYMHTHTYTHSLSFSILVCNPTLAQNRILFSAVPLCVCLIHSRTLFAVSQIPNLFLAVSCESQQRRKKWTIVRIFGMDLKTSEYKEERKERKKNEEREDIESFLLSF